jgi:2-polyprenyl-3-methyl-5-hydroxy-6-metoxy-1,4-benzoquinol methylase
MNRCEVCDSQEILIIPTPAHVKGVFGKCTGCALLQSLQAKRPSDLEGIAFDGYALAQDLNFEKLRRANVLLQIQKLLIENDLDLSVFDIGTGAGYFLVDAQQMGFKISGSELSRTAAAQVYEKHGFDISVKNYEDFKFTNCQSSVTMFCVLAHSVNPELLLISIHKSLKEGGVLYFHTPRYCLIDSLAIGLCRISFGRFNSLFLRRIGGDHKRIYSGKSLVNLLKKAGFSKVTMEPEIGYGLKKEAYFMAMGLPKFISIALASVLNVFSRLNLLPRNVFTVYAIKTGI